MSMEELKFDYANSHHKGESLVTNAENGDVEVSASDMTDPVYYPTLWKIFELVVPVLDLSNYAVTQLNEGADEAWATAKWLALGSGIAKAIVAGASMFMSMQMMSFISACTGIV